MSYFCICKYLKLRIQCLVDGPLKINYDSVINFTSITIKDFFFADTLLLGNSDFYAILGVFLFRGKFQTCSDISYKYFSHIF